MQNSLERLFAGVASSLQEDVLPAVEDPYVRSQVLVSVELLANLAKRVEWRCAELRKEVEAIRAVIGRGDEPVPENNEGLVAARAEALDALARAQEQGLDTPELRAFLTMRLDRDLARLRTGMYR